MTLLRSGIPEATVARLPLYLRALNTMAEQGVVTCSSGDLADATGVNPAKLRKDLSHLGSYGTRGVGYEVEYLQYQIARELGQTHVWDVVIVGAGHLGSALSTYQGFGARGIRVAAVVDNDSARIGTKAGDATVESIDDLPQIVADRKISIAVLATPADVAQDVVNTVVEAGVTSILNFAPVIVHVPEHVELRKVDLSIELQILAYHEQRRNDPPENRSTTTSAVSV